MGNTTSFALPDPVDVWDVPDPSSQREWSLESDEQSTSVANGSADATGVPAVQSRDAGALRPAKTFAMPGESSGAAAELLNASDHTEVFVSLANDDEKRAVIEPPYDQVLYKIVFRHAGFSWAIFRLPSELWTLNMNMYVFHPAQSNDLPDIPWMQLLGITSKSKSSDVDIVVDPKAVGWKPSLEGVKEANESEERDDDNEDDMSGSAASELNEFSLEIPHSRRGAEDRMSFQSADGDLMPDGHPAPGSAAAPEFNRVHRRQGSVLPDDGPRRQTELCRSIANWLTAAANNHKLRRSDAFSLFAEVSAVSFEHDGQHKRIESFGYKKRGGRQYMRRHGCTTTMKRVTRMHWLKPYTKRWFVLRDDYLLYTGTRTANKPMDVVLFDSRFQVLSKNEDPSLHKYSLRIVNSYRSLTVKFQNRRQCLSWKSSLEQAYEECQWNTQYRFSAFAPPRSGCNARVLVDGREHMSQVMACIDLAQDEVFISGWWVTPDLPLTRPYTEGCLLVDVLKRKADQGVKIFVVVYQEISLALYNNSLHTKKVLEEANPNIHVVTHPIQFGARAVWYWSHHQKLVIVDHCIAFVGGIDLCLGRFDSYEHRLCDRDKDKSKRIFPGKDYTNPCIKDFVDVRDIFDTDSEASGTEEEESGHAHGSSPNGGSNAYPSSREKSEKHKSRPLIDRNSQPRMPWHDTSVQIVGPVVSDIARHFVQLWNHIKTDKHKQQDKVQYLQVTGEEKSKQGRTERLKKNLKGKLKKIQEFDVRKHLGGADLLQLNRSHAMTKEHELPAGIEVPEAKGDLPPESPQAGDDKPKGGAESSHAAEAGGAAGHHKPGEKADKLQVPKSQGSQDFARGNTTGMAISLDVLKQIEEASASPMGRQPEGAQVADVSPKKNKSKDSAEWDNLGLRSVSNKLAASSLIAELVQGGTLDIHTVIVVSAKPKFFGRSKTHMPAAAPADAPVNFSSPSSRLAGTQQVLAPGGRRMTLDMTKTSGDGSDFSIRRSFTMDGSTKGDGEGVGTGLIGSRGDAGVDWNPEPAGRTPGSPMYIGEHRRSDRTPVGFALGPESGPDSVRRDDDSDYEADDSSASSRSGHRNKKSPRHRRHKRTKDSPQPGPSLYGRMRSISTGGSPAAATSKLMRPEATAAFTMPISEESEDDQHSIGERRLSIHRQDSVMGASSQRIQFLRSCSWWSMGLPSENSIYQAYMNTIAEANRYIYIENQFFVTTTDAKDPSCADYAYPVVNEIGR
ncbi:Phospholipase D, partial [Perkinsus chesapeaki]